MLNKLIKFTKMTKLLKIILSISGVTALILLGLFYFSPAGVAQTSGTNLSGYAWSDNIGWIDFSITANNPNGVSIDGSGYLTGYAWSDNIGWIKFGGLSSFPSGPGTASQNAQIASNKLIGWAKACGGMYDISLNQTVPNNTCSGSSRTDGWDGWISFGGNSPSYNVSVSGGEFSGYAWGSDVVGWIDFNPPSFGGVMIVTTPITIQFDADPLTVLEGNSSIISWSSTGADSCTVTKDGLPFATGISNTGKSSGPLSSATTFEIQCNNISNSENKSLVVDVTPLPPPPPPEPLVLNCASSQPGNAPGDTNMYVNRNTVWVISNTEPGTFSDVVWSGTNISSNPPPTEHPLNKIYTTVGQKDIHAEATFTRSSDGKVFSASCSANVVIKLDSGTSGEI